MSDEQTPFGNQALVPFSAAEFANNPQQRCPCLLLLDTSGSMAGNPIQELNAGLLTLRDELMADSLAANRVELAIITFGPTQVMSDYQTADVFHPPTLQAGGDTPMASAIKQGIDLLTQRKDAYRRNGVSYYRPWIFLITDGAPTDYWQGMGSIIREGEKSGAFTFYAVGVEGANMDILRQISTSREPLRLKGLNFRELFRWLSNSLSSVSRSTPGQAIPLENPTAPNGWAFAA